MDISNSYQSNDNNTPARSSAGGAHYYGVVDEKKRIELGTEELKKELLAKWKKEYVDAQIFPAPIAAIHPEVVNFLLSFNLVSVYDNIAKQSGLDAEGRNVLPRVVWQIAQAKNWDGLDQALESSLPLVHSSHVTVAQLLQQYILNEVRALSEKPVVKKNGGDEQMQKKEIQLPLSQALVQYPKLGEQNVTGDQIKLRYFPTPVRPSIKNWMTDFHDAMGSMKHSPIDRGNFLFHSENGKKLAPIDRQKLGTILKSLDEQILLTIDSDAQVVVFENAESQPALHRQADFSASRGGSPVTNNQSPIWDSKSPEIRQDISRVNIPKVQRENKPDIDLRQNQDARGNVVPELKRESNFPGQTYAQNQNQQSSLNKNTSYSPNFSAKLDLRQGVSQISAEKSQAGNTKNFFSSVVVPSSAPSGDDFFQIPQSKPPIGSEHFNTVNTEESLVDNRPIADNGTAARAARSQQNPDLMSNDSLYEMLQEKNIQQESEVSFSSPQKLPVEQDVKSFSVPTQKAQQQPALKTDQFSHPIAQRPEPSLYHIKPTDYAGEKKDGLPRINGNIVDLKN